MTTYSPRTDSLDVVVETVDPMRSSLPLPSVDEMVIMVGPDKPPSLPQGFTDMLGTDDAPRLELRYLTPNNFVGRPVDGYRSERLILTYAAAGALRQAQRLAEKEGLGLKVFDAYRPKKAVAHFMHWAAELSDTVTKAEYYPHLHKTSLIDLGYIASRSSHSRGSTVDLTLVYLKGSAAGEEMDMGTPYDYFGARSGWNTDQLTDQQMDNRYRLRRLMESVGFRSIEGEWWHYTLVGEPFADQYFDFDVE